MRRGVVFALFVFGLAIPAAVPVAIAAPSSVSEFKSCVNPGQISRAKSGYDLACTRGINGKLLWVNFYDGNSSPGEPAMRACGIAGDRKVFRYWRGNPSEPSQNQFVCVIATANLIKYMKSSMQNLCWVTSSSSDYSYSQEKGRCNFASRKVGQKMWLQIWNTAGTNANILTDEASYSSPSIPYVTEDLPQIPSCFLERSCGPKMMVSLQKVVTEYPNAIVFPPKKSPLNFPPPSLGKVDAQTDCFGSSWCRALGTQDGQIVIEGQGVEWNTYGVKNNISQFFFKLTSPSGKIEFSNKFKFPYEYYFTTFRVKEIGLWSVQIAGWSGIQQTDWSLPKVVQVRALQSSQNDVPATDCASKSGSLVAVKYEMGMVSFANPFNCSVTVVISGQVNCRATWVPIPVSATFSMYSRESISWGLGGVFPNALSLCQSYMNLAGLTYDGSGGLTMCATKSCLSALTLIGRIS
jgi:hypothetical protein